MQKNIRKKGGGKGKKIEGKGVIYCLDKGDNFRDHRKMMQDSGYDFDVITTNSTKQLVRRRKDGKSIKYMYSDSFYKFKELNMFRDLKKEVHKNIAGLKLDVPDYKASDVKYFQYSNTVRSVKKGDTLTLSKCLELDITMAYYKTANRLGYISEEFYEKCRSLPKLQRLRLIGSIATNKTVYQYRGGKLIDVRSEKDDVLRRVWFHICYYVDQCMQEFAFILGNKFLFYWVDGIYVTGGWALPAQLVYSSMEYDFDFKPKRIDKIVISCSDDNDVMMHIHKEDKTIKPFNVKKDLSEYGRRLAEQHRDILEQKNE